MPGAGTGEVRFGLLTRRSWRRWRDFADLVLELEEVGAKYARNGIQFQSGRENQEQK